jgi:hypothetical protein
MAFAFNETYRFTELHFSAVLLALPKRTKSLVATRIFLKNYGGRHRTAKASATLYVVMSMDVAFATLGIANFVMAEAEPVLTYCRC